MPRPTAVLFGAVIAIAGMLPTTPGNVVPRSPAAAPPLSDGAIFNDPTQPTAQYRIVDYLRRLIQQAAPGSTIRLAVQYLTLDTIAGDLTSAHARGVNVKVIVDFEATHLQNPDDGTFYPTPAWTTLTTSLGTNTTSGSWAMNCTRDAACIGTAGTPVMQNKFALFSNTAGATNVVFQTSANLSAGQQENAWNNAVSLSGNTALYNAYTAYFADLTAMAKTADYYRTTTAGTAKVYFFPRAQPADTPDADSDTIVEILNNVTCTGNTNNGGKTVIRVAMYFFTRTAIASKLWDLDNQGCQVQILYTLLGDGVKTQLTKPGGAGGAPELRNSNAHYNDPDGNRQSMYLHSKYLLIEGNYFNVPDDKVVFTGSPNYTIDGLRYNDEALLKIENAQVHDQYRQNFTDAWNASATPD
jgi:phosphatidylserine/phosphatidylglycerophosphate/cardiolipin synthase-like enzyme